MSNRDEALIVVSDWLKTGIPQKVPSASPRPVAAVIDIANTLDELKKAVLTPKDLPKIEKILQEKGLASLIIGTHSPEAEPFVGFLRRFWDYEKSPYADEKRSHKINITRKYMKNSLSRVNLYWAPYFEDKLISQITETILKIFRFTWLKIIRISLQLP
jgi:hypothetical protein